MVILVPGELGTTVTYVDRSWKAGEGILTSRSLPDGRIIDLSAGPGVLLEVGSKSLQLGTVLLADLPDVLGKDQLDAIFVRCSQPVPGGPEVKSLTLSFSCPDQAQVQGEISIEMPPSAESRLACGYPLTLDAVLRMDRSLLVMGASLSDLDHAKAGIKVREDRNDCKSGLRKPEI